MADYWDESIVQYVIKLCGGGGDKSNDIFCLLLLFCMTYLFMESISKYSIHKCDTFSPSSRWGSVFAVYSLKRMHACNASCAPGTKYLLGLLILLFEWQINVQSMHDVVK